MHVFILHGCMYKYTYIHIFTYFETLDSLTSFLSYNIKPHFILLNIIQNKVLMALWLYILYGNITSFNKFIFKQ